MVSLIWLFAAITVVLLLICATLVVLFRCDHRSREARLKSFSRVVTTTCGTIELAEVGRGDPILVIHGGMGGADQMADLMEVFDPVPGTFLCISRPGHLRTPLSSGRSVSEQTDLFAALLDALRIQRVPVLGVSLGASFALRFAQRHPERVSGVVLIGASFQAASTMLNQNQDLTHGLRKWRHPDFVGWLVQRFGLKRFTLLQGVSPSLWRVVSHDPLRRRLLHALIAPLATIGRRLDGLENDDRLRPEIEQMTLEGIDQPVLLVHGRNDGFAPVAEAERIAATLPRATLHLTSDGGHVCLVTHRSELVPVVNEFLRQRTMSSPEAGLSSMYELSPSRSLAVGETS